MNLCLIVWIGLGVTAFIMSLSHKHKDADDYFNAFLLLFCGPIGVFVSFLATNTIQTTAKNKRGKR